MPSFCKEQLDHELVSKMNVTSFVVIYKKTRASKLKTKVFEDVIEKKMASEKYLEYERLLYMKIWLLKIFALNKTIKLNNRDV